MSQKKSAKKILRLHDTHKMYILQKNWTKTVNPALSSGLNFFPPPIWGHHHQLDDQHRNPNMNNKDHLVGQLTSLMQISSDVSRCPGAEMWVFSRSDTSSYGCLVAVLERDVEIRMLANVQILKWLQVGCDKNQIAFSLLPLSLQRPAARPQGPLRA